MGDVGHLAPRMTLWPVSGRIEKEKSRGEPSWAPKLLFSSRLEHTCIHPWSIKWDTKKLYKNDSKKLTIKHNGAADIKTKFVMRPWSGSKNNKSIALLLANEAVDHHRGGTWACCIWSAPVLYFLRPQFSQHYGLFGVGCSTTLVHLDFSTNSKYLIRWFHIPGKRKWHRKSEANHCYKMLNGVTNSQTQQKIKAHIYSNRNNCFYKSISL